MAEFIFEAMKILISTLLLFFSSECICQTQIDVDKVDSIAKQIELSVSTIKSIQKVCVKEPNDDIDFLGDCYFIDTLNKGLHKVVSSRIIETNYSQAKKRNRSSFESAYIERYTLRSIYYFVNDSFIKVYRQTKNTEAHFYFKNGTSFQKVGTHHGRAFIITEETASAEFLKAAKKYIRYYKLFPVYATSQIRTKISSAKHENFSSKVRAHCAARLGMMIPLRPELSLCSYCSYLIFPVLLGTDDTFRI